MSGFATDNIVSNRRTGIDKEVATLKRKGVITDAVPDAYLQRVVLVAGWPDHLA